jgi:nucleoside-diphosphate-sugar epimerase
MRSPTMTEISPWPKLKRLVLAQAQAYRQQYGFEAIYILSVNLYGPRDNFDPEIFM